MSSFDLTKVIPEWINQKSFFEKVIRHMEKDERARVETFEIGPAGKPGENFASAVFRAKVIYVSKYAKSEKTISMIVKVKPVLGPEMAMFAAIIEKSPFFPYEMSMYGRVLPQIQSLLSAAGDNEILSPKWVKFYMFSIFKWNPFEIQQKCIPHRLIYQSNDPTPIIVLEDACEDGYATISSVPEDFEETKKVFKRLAKYHAGSFYLANENVSGGANANSLKMFDENFVLLCNAEGGFLGFQLFVLQG